MYQNTSCSLSPLLPPNASTSLPASDQHIQAGNGALHTQVTMGLSLYEGTRLLFGLIIVNSLAFTLFSSSLNLSPLSIVCLQTLLSTALIHKLLNMSWKTLAPTREVTPELNTEVAMAKSIDDQPRTFTPVSKKVKADIHSPLVESSHFSSISSVEVLAKDLRGTTHAFLVANRLVNCKIYRQSVLDLENLNIAYLPEEIFEGCSHIKKLSLKHNKLTTLPESLGKLTQLTELDLSFNHLDELPDNLDQLANLAILELTHNEFQTLPTVITSLNSLTTLNVSHNLLHTLPTGLGYLPALKYLRLSYNRLFILPQSLCRAPKLTFLDISKNFISSLDRPLIHQYAFQHLHIQREEPILHTLQLEGLSKAVAAWYSRYLPDTDCVKQILFWEKAAGTLADEKAEDFMQLLTRLPSTQFFQSATGQKALFHRMDNILTSMREDKTLRQYCFTLATEGLESCSDRVTLTLNHIEIACLINKIAEEDIHAYLTLAKGLFRLDRLDKAVAREIEARKAQEIYLDEIEIHLYYRYALHEVLSLPAPVTHMSYQTIADIDASLLEAASNEVLDQEINLLMVAEYICTQEFWDTYLQKKYKKELDALLAKSQKRLEEVEANSLNDKAYKQGTEAIYQAYQAEVFNKKKAWTVQFLTVYAEIEEELSLLASQQLLPKEYQKKSQEIQQRYHMIG